MASPEPGTDEVTRDRWTLPILFGVIILDLVGFGIVLPILPYYAEAYGASGTVLGLLLAVHAAMQFAFAPVWGRISDRIGRRRVMLVTIAGTGGALLMLALADSIPALFVARALSGLFAANISVATAYVTDVTAESERTRWMGMVGASFGIGFVLGPGVGALLVGFGYTVPIYAAAGLAAANCVAAIVALREPPRHVSVETGRLKLSEIAREPVLGRLCGINFLFTFGVTQLESIFAYWMMLRFDFDAQSFAGILVLMAVVMGAIQGGAMRRLAARYGERTLLLTGLSLMAVAFPLVPVPASVALLLVPLLLSAVGRAIAQPPMLSLTSMRADPGQRGRVMGAFQSAASLARVIGPLVAGMLFDAWAPSPFYLAGLALAGAAFVGLGHPREEQARMAGG